MKFEALPPHLYPELYENHPVDLGDGLTLRELYVDSASFEQAQVPEGEEFTLTLRVTHRDTRAPTAVVCKNVFPGGTRQERAAFVRTMLVEALTHEVDELLELDGAPVCPPHGEHALQR